MNPRVFTAPEVLTADHHIADFASGEKALDEWLKTRALKNNDTGGSRTFVVCTDSKKVAGFYSLSTSSIAREHAPRKAARNMPDPLPAMLLGRLAVDRQHQKKGLGKGLVRDALLRTARISQDAGIALVLVHALHDAAKDFYLSCGFVESPIQSMTVMMTMATVRTILTETE